MFLYISRFDLQEEGLSFLKEFFSLNKIKAAKCYDPCNSQLMEGLFKQRWATESQPVQGGHALAPTSRALTGT